MGYTYYGDLLGISGYYNLSAKLAYRKLNEFYDTTFYSLSDYCNNNPNVKVNMFSDSILIWGDDSLKILEELQQVYIKLLHKRLLLRGAIVDGKLQMDDARLELKNYKKMLPKDDKLARAVGLQAAQKGARLLIENRLADKLLSAKKEWLTIEGYNNDIKKSNTPFVPYESVLRRICPTNDNNGYELLYFWAPQRDFGHEEVDYKDIIEELYENFKMYKDKIADHYKSTIDLLRRCQLRQNYTMDYGPSPVNSCDNFLSRCPPSNPTA
ncbi:MAG: hypothetical protein ACLPYB_00825 [Desulfobaccales bacterium]